MAGKASVADRIEAWAELVDLGVETAYQALLRQMGPEAARDELRARLRREDAERRLAKQRVLRGLARAG
jgi:hypothetical protein